MLLYVDLYVNKNNFICLLRVSVFYWFYRFVVMIWGYKGDEKIELLWWVMVR